MSGSYIYDPHIWPALITVGLITFLAVYSWRHRKVPGARPFAVGSLFAALWALGTVLEISSQDFSTRVFWVKFETLWQMPTATAIMCFILVYAGFGRWLTRRNLILLAIPPLITLVLVITNDYHHLIWTGFRMNEYVLQSAGSINRLLVGYTYFLALINLIVLLWLAVRSPQHRVKKGVVITGSSTAVNMGIMLEGNADDTSVINITDFGILAATYGKSTPDYDNRADFDRNGIINIADFGLLAANYGKSAPVEVP